MNILLHLIFLFIFVYALLLINIPGISVNSYLENKIYLFISIFFFQFIVMIINNINNKCHNNFEDIAKKSLVIALIGVIGFSVFYDLALMKNDFIIKYEKNEKIRYAIISSIIILFISLYYFIEMLFTNISSTPDCELK